MSDHLHDETLSDVIDGIAPADVLDHLDGCARCTDRLQAMQAGAAAVAAPPPLASNEARDVAIARALGTGAAPARRFPPWLAAAAAVVVLLGVVAVAMARTGNDNNSNAALNESKEAQDAAGTVALAGPVDGGDLGEQRDPAALHALLEGRLGARSGAASATGGSEGATDSGSAGGAAPQAATRAPEAPPSGPACLAEAQQAGSGRLGPLQLYANLRWQGQRAVALVFAAPSGSQLGRRAFVMARRDCSLLVAQSF